MHRTNLAQALDNQVDELIKGGGVEAILAKNKYEPNLRPGSARTRASKPLQLMEDKDPEIKSWPKIGPEIDE